MFLLQLQLSYDCNQINQLLTKIKISIHITVIIYHRHCKKILKFILRLIKLVFILQLRFSFILPTVEIVKKN